MYTTTVIIWIANKHLLQQFIFFFQGYVLVSPMVEYNHPQWFIQKLTNDLYSALRIFPSAGLL